MNADPSVILASAGSGKTFELAGRYVDSLRAPGARPERILATTFTRKAAGEMLAKVLRRLLDAAAGTDVGLGLKRADAAGLCLSVARSLDRVRVQTLDSYFAETGRMGAAELRLAPGWRILDELEFEEIKEEAIDEVCRVLDARTLIRVIESMNGGGLPMLPRSELLRRASEVHDAFLDSGATTERWGSIEGDPTAVLSKEALKEAIKAFRAAPVVMTKGGSPAKRVADARPVLEALLDAELWAEFLKIKLAVASVSSRAFGGSALPDSFCEPLGVLVRHAQSVEVDRLREKTRAAAGLVTAFDSALESAKERRNAVTFDDLPRRMLSLSPEERDWIAFRLDGRVDHLLLDEFQDTSRLQYRVLEPLLTEITSQQGRTLFAVGDVKQSLYGWRGAVPELLETLADRLHLGAPATRAKSWRSAQVVLDAVNTVFAGLPANPVLGGYEPVAARWCRNFSAHTAAKSIPGQVRIHEASLDEDDSAGAVLDRAAELVQEIRDGHPAWSVGVLTRTNKPVPRCIHRLKQLGIQAAQDKGHPLTDEPCVNGILSLLQLAEHPGDSASQYHVAKTCLAPLLALSSPFDAAAGQRVARDVRERIAREGISGLVSWLRKLLAPQLAERGRSRLEHMERLALGFDQQPDGRIPEFIRLVQDTAITEPAPGTVSVLTVHKAKGLEWDAVVLVDLEHSWKGRTPQIVVDRGEPGENDPLAPVQTVTLWPSEPLQELDPRLGAIAARQKATCIREAISGLYVALTRARRHLEIVLPNQPKASEALNSATILRSAFGLATAGVDGGLLKSWESGGKEDRNQSSRRSAPVSRRVQLSFAPVPDELRGAHAPSRSHQAEDARAILRESALHADARTAGTVWHAWFETVEWSEEWKLTDAELEARARPFGWSPEQCREHLSEFRRCMSGPAAAALSRKRYQGRPGLAEVAREWGLAWNTQGLVSGRMDRVVIGLVDGKPAWAEVLDFKTDRVHSREEAVDRYRAQIDAYRHALARCLRLPLASVGGLLLFVKSGLVCELEDKAANAEQ